MRQTHVMEPAARTIELLTDTFTFVPATDELVSRDPLGWPGYEDSLVRVRRTASGNESVVAGRATVGGVNVEIAVFDFAFIAGSMGEVAGERLARAIDRAAERATPLVLVTSTGGARMQEGMVSLIQMPKLVAARLRLADAAQPLIAILEHPTTGGVLASIAALADVSAAVEGATIGFAGPRVVERFTGRPLEPGSHSAQSAFANGLVDALIARDERRKWLADVVAIFAPESPGHAPAPKGTRARVPAREAWARVQSIRAGDRPTGPDLISAVLDTVAELRGDRAGSDDRAIVTVLGRLYGRRVMSIAFDRRLTPGPGAYRKATRALRLASHLAIPVVTTIDTRGADPSAFSEAGGVAWGIAEAFAAMLSLPVPVVTVVTGEGGSGGALALAAGDVLLAFEASVFSVIDPEAAAEILWRRSDRAAQAAELLKLGAEDLLAFGVLDALLPEPIAAGTFGEAVAYHLDLLSSDGRSGEQRVRDRRARWRGAGGT